MSPTLDPIAAALAAVTDAAHYARDGDPAGVWLASPRPVQRLGLRLDVGRPPYAWAEPVDAVLVHRPFGLWPARWPRSAAGPVGVLAYHRALDDRLSVGPSPPLADALGLALDPEPLRRDGRTIGRIGTLDAPLPLRAWLDRLTATFGGIEATAGAALAGPVDRVAVVGAMTAELVEAAARRGATVYLTGQIRAPGRPAAERCGVLAVATGQDRAERWGLRYLARLASELWPDLEVVDLDV